MGTNKMTKYTYLFKPTLKCGMCYTLRSSCSAQLACPLSVTVLPDVEIPTWPVAAFPHSSSLFYFIYLFIFGLPYSALYTISFTKLSNGLRQSKRRRSVPCSGVKLREAVTTTSQLSTRD